MWIVIWSCVSIGKFSSVISHTFYRKRIRKFSCWYNCSVLGSDDTTTDTTASILRVVDHMKGWIIWCLLHSASSTLMLYHGLHHCCLPYTVCAHLFDPLSLTMSSIMFVQPTSHHYGNRFIFFLSIFTSFYILILIVIYFKKITSRYF